MRVSIGTAALLLTATAIAVHGDVIDYWRFEEGNGSSFADGAGGIQGNLIGVPSVQWSMDVPGVAVPLTGQPNNRSLVFGGAGMADITTEQTLALGASFTIELFLKPDEPIVASPIFGFGGGDKLYGVLGGNAGGLFFRFQFENDYVFVQAPALTLGAWHHMALVKNADNYAVYVDGTSIAAGALPAGTEGSYVFPGSEETGTRSIGNGFRGYIDEFRISDTALTPDQFLMAPEPGTLGFVTVGGLAVLFHLRRSWCVGVGALGSDHTLR